jgi:hypothetical protein
MTKKASILVLLFLLSSGEIGCAEPLEPWGGPGSANRARSLLPGYDGRCLNLKEYSDSSVLDKDTGWQTAIDTGAGFAAEKVWLRTLFAYSRSSGTKYCGSLDGYTPVNLTTEENFGYRLLDINASGLASFSGIGDRDRDWERDGNSLADYLQLYTWYYFPVGVNYVLTIEADAAVQLLFSMKMKTGMGGPAAIVKSGPSERTEIVAVATPYYRYTCWY